MPPHVCIVTSSPIGSNPRVVKEADALSAAGYRTTIVATRMLDLVEPRDAALMARAPWRLERIDLRSRATWWLRRASQIAAQKAWQATHFPRLAPLSFSPATLALSRAAARIPADLYIAHYPAALPAAAAAAKRHGARFAYDAEDFHLGDWPDGSGFAVERGLVRDIEARFLPGCSYVTAASPGIAESYAAAYGIARPAVVLNVFPKVQAPVGPTPRGSVEPGPSVYWFSQTIGPNRGLEGIVEAIARAKAQPHLYLRGTPSLGFIDSLRQRNPQVFSSGRVHLLPPGLPDEMVQLSSCYDLGLCSEPGHTVNNSIALSNKLFTYLAAGVPPLISDTQGQLGFAAEAGLGDLVYPVGDARALAELFDRVLGDTQRLSALRARCFALGQERYNWERESEVFLSAVEVALRSRRAIA